MEHQTAVERRFTERYLLGELSPSEAAEFEAHFFECALCADEVRQSAGVVANLKAVLKETIHPETIGLRDPPVEIRWRGRFLDLTIPLDPSEIAPRIECEFQFASSRAPAVIPATVEDNSIRLTFPASRIRAGQCTVVLRDGDSRRVLGRRKLLIPEPE